MKYDIVSAATLSGLVWAVNETGPEWQPVGGLVVIPKKDRTEVSGKDGKPFTPVFAQTMVRKVSPEKLSPQVTNSN